MKKFKKFLTIGIIFLGLSIVWAQEDKITPKASPHIPPEMKQTIHKPDLIVKEIQVEKITQYPQHTTPQKIKAKIIVTVKNLNIPSNTENSLTQDGQARQCGGTFKTLVEWTDNPQQGYKYLCHARITKLSGGQTFSFICEYWFPYYAAVKIKATVDYLNWIDEANENNNISVIGYIAR
ncbi:MAG: CARDB domain-containing protein [Thermodesulfovibrionaceae bacterium]